MKDLYGALWVQWWLSKQTGFMDFYGSANRRFNEKIMEKVLSKQTTKNLFYFFKMFLFEGNMVKCSL
jgi:hypothetical protein